MKQTMLAFVLSAFALTFLISKPAFAQNVAQCISACKKGGSGGGSDVMQCIERCKQMK